MKNHTEPTAIKPLLFIGLDVHKESIAVAIAEEGHAGEVRSHGPISGDLHALEKVLGRIRHAHEIGNEQMRLVYEAGPCGYVIVRRLRQLGIDCVVIAPRVAFSYRESQTGEKRECVLSAKEFLRRFLQHVLPKRFRRVRTYGWQSPAAKARRSAIRVRC